MFMIINLNGVTTESNPNVLTADGVKYGDSNVGLALSELENELTANGQRIYLDYKDGKYGYNTDALRGADTFSPFKSGDSEDSEYTNLTTVFSVAGDKLPSFTGCGYVILRKVSGVESRSLKVFIDGNTDAFTVLLDGSSLNATNYLRFYFQEEIRFEGARDASFWCQALLAEKEITKKYDIVQGVKTKGEYISFTGKGRVLIVTESRGITIAYEIDNNSEIQDISTGNQYMEFLFTNSFKLKSNNSSYSVYYIAYLEK